MNKLFFMITIILILSTVAFSQSSEKGKLAGTILDKNTGEPLPGVNVQIKGTMH